jgi:hypothetical protein
VRRALRHVLSACSRVAVGWQWPLADMNPRVAFVTPFMEHSSATCYSATSCSCQRLPTFIWELGQAKPRHLLSLSLSLSCRVATTHDPLIRARVTTPECPNHGRCTNPNSISGRVTWICSNSPAHRQHPTLYLSNKHSGWLSASWLLQRHQQLQQQQR